MNKFLLQRDERRRRDDEDGDEWKILSLKNNDVKRERKKLFKLFDKMHY